MSETDDCAEDVGDNLMDEWFAHEYEELMRRPFFRSWFSQLWEAKANSNAYSNLFFSIINELGLAEITYEEFNRRWELVDLYSGDIEQGITEFSFVFTGVF